MEKPMEDNKISQSNPTKSMEKSMEDNKISQYNPTKSMEDNKISQNNPTKSMEKSMEDNKINPYNSGVVLVVTPCKWLPGYSNVTEAGPVVNSRLPEGQTQTVIFQWEPAQLLFCV